MTSDMTELRNEIKIDAAGGGTFELAAFASVFARRLEDAEAVADVNVELLRCNGPRGRRLELLGYAEGAIDQSLTLIAGRYFGSDETLTLTDATDSLSRASDFVEYAASGWLVDNLELSSREWEYADYFAKQIAAEKIQRIRMILITDGFMSNRIRTIDNATVAGIKTTFEIWDQRRTLDAAQPNKGSEDIHVDFTRWLPDGLPCLLAPGDDPTTHTYLAVIPAQVLADVFDEFGSVLLESNVRTFLSARGAVNRGIQNTLAQEPERFLAYNNGLTTTATKVDLVSMASGTAIKSIDRWQIVNGGQTTASIAHFLRNNKQKDLTGVSVQMKLVTVSESDSGAVVQAVAKYANSQNRVSTADLFSTHDFHVRLERISRRLKAPAKEGQQYQSGWYYERARGQWENDRLARGSSSEQNKFELEYPKAQRITKTDWAKYQYTWNGRPDLVSKGAQSVFADFANRVDAQWQKDEGQGANEYGDAYYQTGVGKAIMYETLRSSVLKQDWYKNSPGYLANIVAYAIARFAVAINSQYSDARFNFAQVWQQQALSDAALQNLLDIAQVAQTYLTAPHRPQANVTQWAKQPACWAGFEKTAVHLSSLTENDLISGDVARSQATAARKQRSMDTGYEQVRRVIDVNQSVWSTVYRAGAKAPLSPTESDLVRLFGQGGRKVPTERQAAALLKLLVRMEELGVIQSRDY